MKFPFTSIIDISWPISPSMTSYKDNKPVSFTQLKTFDKNHVRDSAFYVNTHTGTHVDAPSHFLAQEKHVDSFNLKQFLGTCSVFDFTHINDYISQKDLTSLPIEDNSIILFKTRNSLLSVTAPFRNDFIYLEASGAHYLVEKKVKAVGIDYLGIEHSQPTHETHTALLSANFPII